MEQRRKSSPERHSESVVSWRKNGGGPCALATPPVELSAVVSEESAAFLAETTAMRLSRYGNDDILIIDIDRCDVCCL